MLSQFHYIKKPHLTQYHSQKIHKKILSHFNYKGNATPNQDISQKAHKQFFCVDIVNKVKPWYNRIARRRENRKRVPKRKKKG